MTPLIWKATNSTETESRTSSGYWGWGAESERTAEGYGAACSRDETFQNWLWLHLSVKMQNNPMNCTLKIDEVYGIWIISQ